MDVCKSCVYCDNDYSYPGTGYCTLYETYVKEDEGCDDYEDE